MKIKLWHSGHSSYYTAVYFFDTPLKTHEKARVFAGIASERELDKDGSYLMGFDRGMVVSENMFLSSFEGAEGMEPDVAIGIAKEIMGEAPHMVLNYAQHLVIEIEVGSVPEKIVPLVPNIGDQHLVGAIQHLSADRAFIKTETRAGALRIDYLGEDIYNGGVFYFSDGDKMYPSGTAKVHEVKVMPR